MNAGGLKDLFRSEMDDTVATGYLWSDADVYSYIDDAQNWFCRLTDGIADATSAVCSIAVAEGDTWIDLDPSILKIRGANRVSDGKPVEIINYEDMEPRGIRFDGSSGPLTTLVVGMEENKARAAKVVSLDDALALTIFRLPLTTINDAADTFEIPAQHHQHLLHWVKARAYMKQDADCFDRTKSEEFEARFRAYCADAKREQQKKRHKIRVVAYGGI